MRSWRFRTFALALAGVGVNGCAVVGDVFSPDFLTGLRLDPDFFGGPSGKTVLALRNSSDFDATFNVVNVRGSEGDSVPSTTVRANTTTSVVLDCPVGFIGLGQITAAGLDGMAAIAVEGAAAGADVVVPYTTGALESGVHFLCGDVVEMELQQIGVGAAPTDYQIGIRIIPGR